MKSHYAEYILVFTFLVPHVGTEYSFLCGKKSSYLQCHQNATVDIHYVNFRLWRYGCPTAESTSCNNQTRLIKEKCSTRQNCSLSENGFKSCNKQPRRVFVKLYCTRRRWWSNSQYTKRVEVCGSLSAIHCYGQDLISGFVFKWWYETGTICENTKDIDICMENILKRCVGHRNCNHINVNTECFHFPLRATISYSCNREGTGSSTTPVNNTRNQSYIPTDDVSPRTFVFDVTKPPNTGEIGFVLNVDRDFRLLIINKKRNKTYSLCANKWENKHARIVCRHLNISDKGNAGNISRNINLTRIAYGVTCPVNITNPFECIPDYSNNSRDICDSIGDATVQCYNHTEKHISAKTGIIVGGILGFIFALVIIVVCIYCLRKRNKKENKRVGNEKRENASTKANYHRENDIHDTGEQERVSLIIPTTPEAATHLDGGQYFVLDPGATGFNRSTKNYSNKDNENAYATSSDGVYDVTNERRHVEKDEINIYSHTVDDVYDTSANDRRGKERDNAYDDCVIQNDD